jgi:hypothetical protein
MNNTIPLKLRQGPTPFYQRLTNLVGSYLLCSPHKEVTSRKVHTDLNRDFEKEFYTLNQVRKALEWQEANNPDFVKKKMGGYHAKCRIYWYEPCSLETTNQAQPE